MYLDLPRLFITIDIYLFIIFIYYLFIVFIYLFIIFIYLFIINLFICLLFIYILFIFISLFLYLYGTHCQNTPLAGLTWQSTAHELLLCKSMFPCQTRRQHNSPPATEMYYRYYY